MKHPCQNISKASIFHEYWWLEAVTAGRFCEVEVRQGDYPTGRLPFVLTRRSGLRFLGMPDFTHCWVLSCIPETVRRRPE